jgi:AcrR family transcriptional regulator
MAAQRRRADAPEPRKLPRQRRSVATVEAILDACSDHILRTGYYNMTTLAVAQRAGVSVGTLYQYFPNREAVAGALALRAMQRLLDAMRRALAECLERRLEEQPATEHLLMSGLDVLVEERAVFGRLTAQAPELFRLPGVVERQRALIQLSQEIRASSGDRLDLPMPEADAWIIGHMVSASMLQISFLEAPEQRRLLTSEVARLTCRMSLEPAPETLSRPAAA